MITKQFLFTLMPLASLILSAQAAQSSSIASAGDIQLSRQEVAGRVAVLSAAQREQLAKNPAPLEAWVREQLADRLLLQEATAQQWDKRPEVAQQIAEASREVIARSYLLSVSQVPEGYPSDAELRAAYNRAKGNLQKPASYRLSQLFIAAAPDDADAQAKARKRALEVVQKARSPKADFNKLIAEYGKGESDQVQNDTGWVTLGQLLPEVRPVVASLQAGEVSDPIQSSAGLHVLKLVEMHEPEQASLDEVRDALAARMRQERQAQIARAYLDSLANGPMVKVDNKAIDELLKEGTTTVRDGKNKEGSKGAR
ncbi:peptidylprolyl isomerase [Kosakonia sp. BYX6]|uniref:Peptidylprolyl isomerase n=1 Tax=Kosakonia calanthes TaxID=3139408 RepID=A0ABZ3BGD1_9ENTR